MNSLLPAALVLLAASATGLQGAQPPPVRGEVVFTDGFEAAGSLQDWPGGALDAGFQSKQSLRVERATAGSAMARRSLPVERLRGCVIRVAGVVRAEGVSDRPQPWNGVKLMLPITSPGGTLYPQAKIGTGTFDWKPVSFIIRIPSDAATAILHLGLEEVTGKVWFDDIRVTVVRPPAPPAPRNVPAKPFRGHSLPRLRGAMVSPGIDAEGIRTFGKEWNANVIRWQLIRSNSQAATQTTYDEWLEGALAGLDAALPQCRKNGLLVVVDLHSPPGGAASPGGYAAADADLFSDKRRQDQFVAVWERIARRYKGVAGIWGFDLANEPIEETLAEGVDDWHDLAERAGKAVRAVDPSRTLIVECAAGGNPGGFDGMEPLDLPNVVYSVHMYLPHAFTHQGVYGASPEIRYPGKVDGVMWDKAQMATALRPVVEFQRKYGVHIYAGEFSAIRWAPDDSAFRYLRDLTDLFEAYGWDWTYHAFREWDGWSVEHGADRKDNTPAKTPTSRQTLLRSWYAKNKKPGP